MSPIAPIVIDILSIATLIGQIVAVGLLGILVASYFFKKNQIVKKVVKLTGEYEVIIVFVISAFAMVGSLTLSEVAGLAPCKLCWYQRIFMYPIAIISFIAMMANEKIRKYVLTLSIVGFAISIYHILMQLFPAAFECSDEVAKCSAVQFAKFGYITIPVMSFTAFLLIILATLIARNYKK